MAVTTSRGARRGPRHSGLGRIGLAFAYLLPALLISVVVLARPGVSQAALVGGACEDVDGITTCEFGTDTPNPTTWMVPDGVTQVTLDVNGGQGGGANGGQGAKVVANMDVSPGDVFGITVGTWGTGEAPAAGGGGTAGPAAEYIGYPTPAASQGYRGGGASSVVYEVESPLIVAAGGGGASADGTAGGAGGGAPSTATAGAGTPATVGGSAAAGSGGTGMAGAGGVAFAYVPDNVYCPQPPGAHDDGLGGGAGTFSTGGAGGAGYAGGGGGGGGFPAGGGGAGGWVCADDDNDVVEAGGSGGGGGGASWYDGTLLSEVTTETGVGGGEGYVVISYATPDGSVDPGYLDATLATGDAAAADDQDLTALGATDWAVWGYGDGNDTSLAPNVRKSGGTSISSLTAITGDVPGVPRRGLGFLTGEGVIPWRFDWSNGTTVEAADSAVVGLQWDGHTGYESEGGLDVTGYGFSFTVPAGTGPQRLHVWTHAHGSEGLLTASLSDDSAPDLYHSYVNVSDSYNTPGLFVIDFAADAPGETLTVTWTMIERLDDGNGVSGNPAIYAVALAPQLVTNGGFEQEVIPEGGYVNRPTGSGGLPGWTVGLDGVDQVNDLEWQPFDGNQSIDLGSDGEADHDGNGSLSQSVATQAGQAYRLSFAYGANPDGAGPNPTATVSWGGTDFALAPTRLASNGANWQTFSEIVTASGASTVLSFAGVTGGLFGVTIDDVSVIPLGAAGEDPVDVAAPVLVRAVPTNSQTTLLVGHTPEPGDYRLTFTSSDSCVGGELGESASVIGSFEVETTAEASYFAGPVNHGGAAENFVAVRVTGPGATTSETSQCLAIQPDNDSWPYALPMNVGSIGASASGFLDSEGNSRWFKFTIAPGARVTIDLSGLPKDYDLFLFKDIAKAYDDLTTVTDLTRISAEFAPSAFAPSAFAPSAFAPSAFAPSAFAPSAFAPSAFAPSAFAPSAFAPSAFAPSAFAPSAFAPSAFAPSAFAPSAFAPSAFAPSAFAPSAFAPSAFASAQVRSLIGISALPGTGDEWIVADTWHNTGEFYVRVSGKNGEFDTTTPFSLDVSMSGTACTGSIPALGTKPVATAGGYETIVLTARDRMIGTIPGNDAAAKSAMVAALGDLPDAVVVDVHAYTASLHAFADTQYACPYYKNLVADAIKDVVDDYRALNPGLANVVLVGNDDVIPFFRYPDQSLLGPEQDYVPPVGTTTTSEGSLRSNMVLGQDEYGAATTISVRGATFPVPDLAVGRLVETATEVTGMVQAFLGTPGGVVPTPTSSLVTGYDFIADAADAIDDELTAGIGVQARRLVTAGDIAPQDSRSWTADQLRTAFLGQRNDISFLGGHFSASGALAADFTTEMRASEVAQSTVDLTNAIVFSIGCHSGYNVVDAHGVPQVTESLDWAQAFARKGATLIAGTGYQYGDTDFIEYSERLYLEFTKQLRTGTGPVAVGEALVAAKQAYLRTTPDIRGLHEKSLLESALFGLPMLSVDMPGSRLPDPSSTSEVGGLSDYDDGPGADLGLEYADITSNAAVSGQTRSLTNLDGGANVVTKFFTGPDGVTTNPLEPALPLDVKNVTVPGMVLRGVGFLGGTYASETLVPLTGAPNTEIRGVHIPFSSSVFYPIRPYTPNYFDALAGPGGATNLLITPVQHRSVSPGSIQAQARVFSSMNLRLFYSDNIQTYGSGDDASTPALSAPPTITGVSAEVDGTTVTFQARVVGDPAAGIQQVWVAYTGHANAFASVDLAQSSTDSSLWTGTATLTQPLGAGQELRFMVQAVNGVGLVTTADDFGALYRATIAGAPTPAAATSTLSLAGSDTTGSFGSTMTAKATLSSTGGVAGKSIVFDLGGTVRFGTTNSSGVATVQIDVTSTGPVPLRASFAGDATTGPSSASQSFNAVLGLSSLTLQSPGDVLIGATAEVTATLTSGDSPLGGKPVVFRVTGPTGVVSTVVRDTDASGTARLTVPSAIVGTHTVVATFGQSVSLPGGGTVGGPDAAYASAQASTTYRVIWPFTGFFAPVENTPIVNVAKAGSSIPIKFSLGGPRTLAILVGTPTAVKISCTSAPSDPVEEAATSGSGLTYDAAKDQYTYVWKTPKAKGCYRLELRLKDDTLHTALFQLK